MAKITGTHIVNDNGFLIKIHVVKPSAPATIVSEQYVVENEKGMYVITSEKFEELLLLPLTN